MRIETFSGTDSKNGISGNLWDASANLKVGDKITANVISNNDGTVTLKTGDGKVFRAQLTDGTQLESGDLAQLVVTDKSEGIVYLAENAGAEILPRDPTAVRLLASEGSAPYARVLESLRLPVTAELVERMIQIVTENPDMTLEQAAFFAANGIEPEPGLLAAAELLFAGDAKIAQMLDELAATITVGEPAAMESATVYAPEYDDRSAALSALGLSEEQIAALLQTGEPEAVPVELPLHSWLGALRELTEIIAEGQGAANNVPLPEGAEPDSETSVSGDTDRVSRGSNDITVVANSDTVASLNGETESPVYGSRPAANEQLSQLRTVFSLLRSMPAFSRVPDRGIEDLTRIISALLRDSQDGGGEKLELPRQIDAMFAALDAEGTNAGSALHRARDELMTRLLYFGETLENSSLPTKQDALRQTERLLDMVRLSSDIDRFAYMQIPIYFEQGKNTAELYIYKNKRSNGRVDPDSVKFLLSLDLEHMGHLESLIAIRGREVALSFETEDDSAESYFKRNTVELHRALAEIGFHLSEARVSVRQSSEATGVVTALSSLFERELGGSLYGIDCTV